MTTTEFTTPRVQPVQPTEGLGGAGAAIYRRMERKQRRPAWLAAIPVGVVALFAVGGFFAYESMNKSAATPQAVAPPVVDAQAPAPAAPIVAPTSAPVAAVPAHEAIAPTPVHHRATVAKHVRARAATEAVRNTSATVARPTPVAAPPASSPTTMAPVSPMVVTPPTMSSQAPAVVSPMAAPTTTPPPQ